MRGVDVNNGRGAIDWGKVRQAGFEFALIKATEGRTWDDPLFTFNMRSARAAGLVVGAYHYARPDNNSARAEAEHFLRVHRPQPGELLPALDWEVPPPTASWALEFLRIVENAIGARPLFYTFPDFLRRTGSFDALSRFPLWYAAYGPNDGNEHPVKAPSQFRFVIHQFSSKVRVPGIPGDPRHPFSDVDVLKLDSLDSILYRPSTNGQGFGGELEMFAGGSLVSVGNFRKPDQTVTDEARRWIEAVRAAGGHGRVEPHVEGFGGAGGPQPLDAAQAEDDDGPPPPEEVEGLGSAGRWSEVPDREDLENVELS